MSSYLNGPANLNSLNVAAESVFSGAMSTSDISVTGNVSSSGSVISNGLSVSGSSNLENMTASGSVTVSFVYYEYCCSFRYNFN